MCNVEECKRQEFNFGLCLDHLRVFLNPEPVRKTRTKKIDTVEVLTTDATDVAEERNDTEE